MTKLLAARLVPALLVAAILPACATDGPAIQEVSPGKGETGVAGDAPIKVTFNHDMDRPTVEARFDVRPAIDGCHKASCPITWTGRTMVLSHPGHPFSPDTGYRVTLRPGYRDSAGRVEGLEHFWDFRTDTGVSISSVTPAEGTTGVAVDVDVSVQLSRAVLLPPRSELTLVAADEILPLPHRVGIAPDDPRRLVVSPLSLLRPKMRYTLHVGPGIEDTHHTPIGAAHDYHFTTGTLNLGRTLAFLVRDESGGGSSRIALLRPPGGPNAPAPSLRLVHVSERPIDTFAWAGDASALYVLEVGGRVTVVPLDGSPARDSGIRAAMISSNPARTELAYATPGGTLHLWRPGPGADQVVEQAGRVTGGLAWSGDGRRLSLVSDTAQGGALRVLDRETLSLATVAAMRAPPTAGPAWSNDGTALAFVQPGTSPPEVWSYRPLAAQGPALTKAGSLDALGLCWSGDGGFLFAAGRTAPGKPTMLYQALGQPLEGQAGGFTPVRGSRPGDGQPAAPAYDRRVSFVRPAAGRPQLWIMNNDGTGVSQLTFATYDPEDRLPTAGVDQPRWAPGG